MVDAQTAKQYADQIGAKYVETSALDGRGVEEMFTDLAKEKLEQVKKDELKLVPVVPDKMDDDSKCC